MTKEQAKTEEAKPKKEDNLTGIKQF